MQSVGHKFRAGCVCPVFPTLLYVILQQGERADIEQPGSLSWHHSEFSVVQRKLIPALLLAQRCSRRNLRDGAYFSSSSSMKLLLSWSMTAKAFLMSASDLPERPTLTKNSLCLKESAAAMRRRRERLRQVHANTHRNWCVYSRLQDLAVSCYSSPGLCSDCHSAW